MTKANGWLTNDHLPHSLYSSHPKRSLKVSLLPEELSLSSPSYLEASLELLSKLG